MNVKLYALCISTLLTTTAGATNYYAAPTGNGAGNTASAPCALTTGIGKLVAGDSLFLMGGQYNLNATVDIKRSGTATQHIFIGAYQGHKPVLDFRNQPHGKNGMSISGNYLHLKGFTVRYAGYKGIINQGSYNTLELIDAYGNCDSGIQHKRGKENIILNCDSHDNFDYYTGSVTAADWGGNADGFADKQYTNSPGNTYIGCRAWNNSDDGWDCYQRVGGTTIIKDCICYANGPHEYDLSNHPRRQTDKDFLDQFDGDGIMITLKGSTKQVRCSLRHFYNNGNGNGFKIGGASTKHDVSLYRCLAIANNVKGFDQNSNAGAIRIYNCTSYLNGSNYGFYNDNGYSLDIRNCISLSGKGSNTFKGSAITQSSNSWNTGFGVSTNDFESLDTTLVCSPRQADGSLAVTPLMRLKPQSKLIDRGEKIEGIDYQGAAPDLGCYEQGILTAISTPTLIPCKDNDRIVRRYSPAGTLLSRNTAQRIVIQQYQSGKTIKHIAR